MPLVLPGLGLGEQAGDQPAEHGDRGIGQLADQLDQLRCDQRVPAPGVEVVGQPARRHGTLAHQLCPTIRMDAPAALRIKVERPHEDQPFDQDEQILFARRLRQGPQPGEAGLPDSGIDGEQPVECDQPLRGETVEQRRLHPPARHDPCGAANPVERIDRRNHRLAFPKCGNDRLSDRHSLVGGGGGRECLGQCRPPVLTNGRMQAKMSLCLDRMLAPVRVASTILGQCTWIDADLLGDEGYHRCRRRLISKDRSTKMAQKTELNGQAKAVMQSTLGLDQIQLGIAERTVSDQAFLVCRHVDKGGPLIGCEKGTARYAQSPATWLRWIAHIRFTWLSLHPASTAVRLIDWPAPRNAMMRRWVAVSGIRPAYLPAALASCTP
jgi:hypothetical protein